MFCLNIVRYSYVGHYFVIALGCTCYGMAKTAIPPPPWSKIRPRHTFVHSEPHLAYTAEKYGHKVQCATCGKSPCTNKYYKGKVRDLEPKYLKTVSEKHYECRSERGCA